MSLGDVKSKHYCCTQETRSRMRFHTITPAGKPFQVFNVNLFNHPESPSNQVSVHCQTLADNSKHNTIACLKAV